MYQLTLTHDERMAIDWIGNRYAHGNDLYDALTSEGVTRDPVDSDWNDPFVITFDIPEHVSWDIVEIAEESEYRFDCFAIPLVNKLTDFCMAIV